MTTPDWLTEYQAFKTLTSHANGEFIRFYLTTGPVWELGVRVGDAVAAMRTRNSSALSNRYLKNLRRSKAHA